MNTDIYGFGEEYHKNYKEDWKQMEMKWDKIFPTLQVNIEVVCKIISTGTIDKPIYPEE